jgi:hypothetical protein
LVTGALAVTAYAAGAFGPAAAVPASAPRAAAAAQPDHHLAYLNANSALVEVAVAADGTVSGRQTLARKVYSVVGSGDGKWLAWTSNTTTPPTITVRNTTSGKDITFRSNKQLVAFAGDSLIATYNKTSRLVLRGNAKPRFVAVPHSLTPSGGTPRHVVTSTFNHHSTGGELRLVSFGGHITVLHRYSDFGQPNYRDIAQSWTSPDQSRFVVERGNHQDFYGLGHSSLMDEYGLGSSHPRTQLGHYGSSKLVWRVATATFVGGADEPWAAWEAPVNHHLNDIKADVAAYRHGHWVLIQHGAIAVAGDTDGDVVVQPGAYQKGHGPDPYPQSAPSSDALFQAGAGGAPSTTSVPLQGVQGIDFWWVAG